MKKSSSLPLGFISILLVFLNSFKCQYMAVAGAGARAEIMAKVGAGAENK